MTKYKSWGHGRGFTMNDITKEELEEIKARRERGDYGQELDAQPAWCYNESVKNKTANEKAEYSQRVVANFLIRNGFELSEVNSPTSNGIDIVAIKDGRHLLIEVKSVIYSARSWRVKKIHPKSDYVAVVMPNGKIHFEHASDWLKLVNKDGTRSITSLVKLYEVLYK